MNIRAYKRIQMKVTTVRLEEDLLSRVDGLAKEMKRSRNWVIQEAVGRFVDYEQWFVGQVTAGRKAAAEGRTIPHDEVMKEIRDKVATATR